MWLFRVALVLSMLCAAPARAGVVDVRDDFEAQAIGRNLELAYDPTGLLTVEDVLAGKLQFAPSPKDVPSFGYRGGAGWARFRIDDHRGAGAEALRLVNANTQTDNQGCFEVSERSVVRRAEAGDQVPFANWDVAYREPTCLVGPGTREVLFRTAGDHSHQIPLTLLTRERFEDRRRTDGIVQSLFFGALLVMAAYNALVAVATRSAAYTYYVAYLLSYGACVLAQGGFFAYLEPSRVVLINFSSPWTLAAIAFASLRFAAELLGFGPAHPWGRWLIRTSVLFPVAVAVASTISYALTIQVALVLVVAWAVLLVGAGLHSLRAGSRLGTLFLAAWGIFILGVVVNVARAHGVLPTNAVTTNAHQTGSVVEFLLLSFALAHRIKELQAEATKQAELAAANAIEASTNAELAAANAELARAATGQALEAQERTNAELRRLDKLKDEFLANTSHELRTPLNGILGLVEVTLGGSAGELPSPAKRNLELVRASGRRLGNLVNDLLDFSRLREKSVTLRTRPVALGLAVDLTLATFTPAADDKSLRLVSAVPDGLGVLADEGRLQQILTNLVGNAVKFTDAGNVTVTAAARDGRVEIRVQDTGIGIPAEAHARIFESFEQADGGTARSYGGTGLGLAVTRQLVELHGGRVTVESEPGGGSTFTFDLEAAEVPAETLAGSRPLAKAPSAPDAARSEGVRVPVAMSTSAPAQGLRILVVDDEPVNREVLAQHLQARGFEVLHAQDGEQAVERIERERPDIVLLDVMMPKKTGYDVLEAVRPRLAPAELPVLLLTAKAQESDLKYGFSLGANDYLLKPVSLVELDARLGHQAGLVRASRALSAELDERRRMQGELDRATSQLTQAENMATLGTMVAGLAHDLRNPLNYVQGAGEVLRASLAELRGAEGAERDAQLAQIDEAIGWVEQGAASMNALTLAMRNQSRSDDGDWEAVDLEEVVRESLLLCGSRTSPCVLKVDVQSATIVANATALGQLVMNLVSNAADAVVLHHDEASGHPKRLRIAAAVDRGRFTLVVEDSGPGIPEELRARILEPFFTTKPRGQGTGLGLAIVQRVVKEHAGTLEVGRSDALGGARFEVAWAAERDLT